MTDLLDPRILLTIIGVCLIPFALGGILLALSKRRYRFSSGRVTGIIGGLGEGKSTFAVGAVLLPAAKAMRSRRGLRCEHSNRPITRIITNFDFWPDRVGLHGVEVIKLVPTAGLNFWQLLLRQCTVDDTGHLNLDAVVCIDEASFYAPSDERAFDPVGHLFLKYARKFNCEVWWLAQDHMQVHKRVRSLTQRMGRMTEVENLVTILTWKRMFACDVYRRDEFEAGKGQRIDRRTVRLSPKVWNAFDTFEAIASSLDDVLEMQAAIDTVTAHAVDCPDWDAIAADLHDEVARLDPP